jgi:hypothetical protein
MAPPPYFAVEWDAEASIAAFSSSFSSSIVPFPMDLAYGNSLPKGNRAVLDLNQENQKICSEKNFFIVLLPSRTNRQHQRRERGMES